MLVFSFFAKKLFASGLKPEVSVQGKRHTLVVNEIEGDQLKDVVIMSNESPPDVVVAAPSATYELTPDGDMYNLRLKLFDGMETRKDSINPGKHLESKFKEYRMSMEVDRQLNLSSLNKLEQLQDSAHEKRQQDAVKNEQMAVLRLRVMNTAIEIFAVKNDKVYPSGMEDLMEATPPYLSDTHANRVSDGYIFTWRLQPTEYKISAEPVECGVTGNKSFFIVTGGILSEAACQ